MARDDTVLEEDSSSDNPEDGSTTRRSYLKTAGVATAATIAATGTVSGSGDDDLPNLLTVVGQGTPSSFELTVDGEIEMVADDHVEEATVVSGTAVEGAIEDDQLQFRFSGDLTDVTFVDRGVTGVTPAAAPNVHVDYGAPDQ